MLPDTKVKTIKTGNRPNCILVGNLRSSEIFRPRALSDYEKKKEEEKKNIHAEINRVSLINYDI